MALSPGTRIGVYEVVAPIGQGAMGQVYRSRDTTLHRDVAIKVLPEAFANDAERLTRFTREARTLAALNHPNIAQIHGLEEGESHTALVMELVEGDDLSTIITRGPLPLQECLSIARQMADALEAAHEQGIVHRDLKPANVRIRPDGTVKILDFGLAKALGPTGALAPSLSSAPTMTSGPTERGVILGTAAYMPPEQARGKPVDKRADIWAFGVVVFEMLTGTRAFQGDGTSDVLAAVLRHEIDWKRLPPNTPPGVRQLLKRCLEPDAKLRLRDIGEARVALASDRGDDTASVVTAPHQTGTREKVAWGIAIVALLVATAMVVQQMSGGNDASAERGGVSRLLVLPPPGLAINPDSTNVAISPNGRMVAFIVGTGPSVGNQLWVRPLDSPDARRIGSGDGAAQPFWSPDSNRIGFFSQGQLKTVAAGGGPAQVVCKAPFARGGAWNTSDVIIFASDSSGPLYRVAAGGGNPSPVTTIDPARKETSHRYPVFLPDGEHFLFAALPGTDDAFPVFAGSLRDSQTRIVIGPMESAPEYVDGFLLFTRQSVLAAQQFNARELRLVGDAVTIGDVPGVAPKGAAYDAGRRVSASSTGSLVYFLASSGNNSVHWLDLSGRMIGSVDVPGAPYSAVSISGDGTRAVLVKADSPRTSSLWLVELARASAVPLWSGAGITPSPTWSPDNTRIVFGADSGGQRGLFEKAVSGASAERAIHMAGDLSLTPQDWSAEHGIIFSRVDPETRWNIFRVPESGSASPVPLINGPSIEIGGPISPDGRWIAYVSDEAGNVDLYVRSLKSDAHKSQVATGGILQFWWAPGGRALLYLKRDQTLWRVSLDMGVGAPRIGAPEQLGTLPPATVSIDFAPDGKRLLALVPEHAGLGSVMVVHSWQSALPGK